MTFKTQKRKNAWQLQEKLSHETNAICQSTSNTGISYETPLFLLLPLAVRIIATSHTTLATHRGLNSATDQQHRAILLSVLFSKISKQYMYNN